MLKLSQKTQKTQFPRSLRDWFSGPLGNWVFWVFWDSFSIWHFLDWVYWVSLAKLHKPNSDSAKCSNYLENSPKLNFPGVSETGHQDFCLYSLLKVYEIGKEISQMLRRGLLLIFLIKSIWNQQWNKPDAPQRTSAYILH